MKISLILLIIVCLTTVGDSQDLSSRIKGSWMLKEYKGKTRVIECPDMLVFGSGVYSILNDCYGNDPKYPVIEKGKLMVDDKKNSLMLTQSKILSNSFFQNSAKSLILIVKEVNNRTMKISFNMDKPTVAIFEKTR